MLAASALGIPCLTSRPCRPRSTNSAVSRDAQYPKWLLMALSHGFSVGPVCKAGLRNQQCDGGVVSHLQWTYN